MGIGRQIRIYEEDMEYLKQRIPEMGLISAEYHTWQKRLSYKDKNRNASGEACISADNSPSQIWVLPTKEELYIARDTKMLMEAAG